MTDYLSNISPISLTISGTPGEAFAGAHHAYQSITPSAADGGTGYQVHSWQFGANLWIETLFPGGEVGALRITGAEHTPVLELDHALIESVDPMVLDVALDDTAVASTAVVDERTTQHRVELGERTVTRWLRYRDSAIVAGIDAEGVLAVLLFDTVTPEVEVRRVTIVGGQHRFELYGTSHLTLGLDLPPDPSMMTMEEQQSYFMGAMPDDGPHERTTVLRGVDPEQLLSLHEDGRISYIATPARVAPIGVPVDAEPRDRIDVDLDWPAQIDAHVEVVGDGGARIRVAFDGLSADRWIELGTLLAGVTDDGRLAELIAPSARYNSQSEGMYDENDGSGGMSEADQLAQHHVRMQQHYVQELARVDVFAAAPDTPVYVPAAQPKLPATMRMEVSMWSSDTIVGVTIDWFDEAALYDADAPDAWASAPRLSVLATSQPSVPAPTGPPPPPNSSEIDVDSDAWEVAGATDEAQQLAVYSRQRLFADAELTPRDHERLHHETLAFAGELEASKQPTVLVVDGVEHLATIMRTDHGFAVGAVLDGHRVSVLSYALGSDVPALVTATPEILAPIAVATHAQAARRDAMFDQNVTRPDVPEGAAAARAAAEELAGALRAAFSSWHPTGVVSHDLAWAFSSEVVAHYGAPGVLDARMRAWSQVLQDASGVVFATDEKGTVAHVGVDISLPRPDGAGRGSTYLMSEWWSHTADEVSAAATSQYEPGDLPEYDLKVNLLIEPDEDGTWKISTDLLAQLDRLTGGIDAVLERQRGWS